jgi:glycosyltransferase involved in cell wall biosynthesis
VTVPRIAVVLPDLRGGGAERVCLYLGAEFLKRGHAVDFVLMQARGALIDLVPEGARIVNLGTQRVRGVFWPLVRYLRRQRPDALLAAMWPLTSVSIVAGRFARFAGTIVLSEHSTMSRQYDGWGIAHRHFMRTSITLTYPLATARVCVSGGVADDLARLAGLPRDLFTVIHNPIPSPSPFGTIGAREIQPAGARIVLTVGTLKPQKNYPLLLRAFAAGPAKQGCRLLIVGQGEQESELRALANRLDLGQQVVFAGFQLDPTPFYAMADLFVLSSDNEGFGNVLVEALAHGLPVVSTNCPSGPAEILENGRYGRLVPVGDVDTLASAMIEALSTEHDREALERRAADFTPEIAARKYLELLFPPR